VRNATDLSPAESLHHIAREVCRPQTVPPAPPPSGLRLVDAGGPGERLWTLASELFLAWDRSLTQPVLDERVADLRSLVDLRSGATIRSFAEAAAIPRGDDYRRFRDRMLQRHRRRRLELIAVLSSRKGRMIAGDDCAKLLAFVQQTRRPVRD
jgi:hypothetical protein